MAHFFFFWTGTSGAVTPPTINFIRAEIVAIAPSAEIDAVSARATVAAVAPSATFDALGEL